MVEASHEQRGTTRANPLLLIGVGLALGLGACGGSASTPESATQGVTAVTGTSVATLASTATAQAETAVAAGLDQPSAEPQRLLRDVQAIPGCRLGYRAPASLDALAAAPVAAAQPMFYDAEQLPVWRARAAGTRAQRLAGLPAGVPDDWQRLVDNARRLQREGEALPAALDDGQARATHGSVARDAAYHALIAADSASLLAVRRYLQQQAVAPVNDFTALCFVTQEGLALDGWYWHASWLLRYIVTYDAVRDQLPDAERLVIERSIRRNANAMAAHLDWGLALIFPQRLAGDYSRRAADAAPARESDTWWKRAYDTNGDCQVDAAEQAVQVPVRAYMRADGVMGPTLSSLSQWFNNRRSAAAAAVAAAGAVLDDALLRDRARRYVMEWLTYAVWPDGSEGEYARNGDYCIAQQGVIYAQTNLQAGWFTARLLARRGDAQLLSWQTCQGLFGSACTTRADRPKSLAALVQHQVALRTGGLDWHAPEPWRARPAARAATALGAVGSRYLNGERITDNFHELALMTWSQGEAQAALAAWVRRDATVTSEPFPGTQGHVVATGFGSWAGAWTDVFNAMPAVFLLRP